MLKPVISIVLLVVSLGNQTTPPQQAGGYEGPTRLELSAKKKTRYAGERIELIMRLPLTGGRFFHISSRGMK
jgi:hypothetical protein